MLIFFIKNFELFQKKRAGMANLITIPAQKLTIKTQKNLMVEHVIF